MIDLRFDGIDGDLAALVADVLDNEGADWRAGSRLGWGAVGAAEDMGGSGGTALDRAVIAEAVGAAVAADLTPWAAGVVAALLGREDAHEPQAVVGPLSMGALVALPMGAPATVAAGWGPGPTLTGTCLALGGTDVEFAAVPFASPDGEAMLAVATGHDAVRIEHAPSIDPSRPHCHVHLDGLDPSDATSRVVGAELFTDWLAHQCVVAALDAVGVARTSLARTLDYSMERFQFGRAIGSFQAYKHRCSDMFIEFRMAQSLAFRAAAELADGERASALAAGLSSTSSATFVTGDAIQLHGGIGFTWEAGLHVNLKRARADEIIAAGGGVTARALLAETADTRAGE